MLDAIKEHDIMLTSLIIEDYPTKSLEYDS